MLLTLRVVRSERAWAWGRLSGRAQDSPELFRIVHRDEDVRRILTNRFPDRIFFSIVGDTLYVHAILHGARRDGR